MNECRPKKKPRIGHSVDSIEIKEAWDKYAKSRGYKDANELSRVALITFARQRKPKDGTELYDALKQFLE